MPISENQMTIRMDGALTLWVDANVNRVQLIDNPNAKRKDLKRAILYEFERVGYARRRLDRKGQVAWEATANMRQYLKDAELEAIDDLDND